MITWLQNTFINIGRYKTDPEAVIISCFFNPQKSKYRLEVFEKFYDSIKHLNHRIVECVIGENEQAQLPQSRVGNPNFTIVRTKSLLWHKESLLNQIVSNLPNKFKYVFWVDADVLFTNNDWLIHSVAKLKNGCNILQPFEYCFHLDRDEIEPSDELFENRKRVGNKNYNHQTGRKVWRSFCANHVMGLLASDEKTVYDLHGHVGFAWGARRDVLEECPLYDKALVGGADHIIAHAAVNEIPHSCITNAYRDSIEEINEWSHKFANVIKKEIGYVEGDLYHLWHGDIDKRKYLDRVKEFDNINKAITNKDKNGLYVATPKSQKYVSKYFVDREVLEDDSDFLSSMMMGYVTDNSMLGYAYGKNLSGAVLGSMLNSHSNDPQLDVINSLIQEPQSILNDNVPTGDFPNPSDTVPMDGGGTYDSNPPQDTPVCANFS